MLFLGNLTNDGGQAFTVVGCLKLFWNRILDLWKNNKTITIYDDEDTMRRRMHLRSRHQPWERARSFRTISPKLWIRPVRPGSGKSGNRPFCQY